MDNKTKQDMDQLGQTVQGLKDKGGVKRLLQSEDTKRMIDLLGKQDTVKSAAKAAAAGDPTQLMGMMQKLMDTREGVELIERITKQANESGL